MSCPVPAQERLRGWLCGNFPFGRHPYADSRVWLTEGREVHSRGAWQHLVAPGSRDAGDGRTGPGMVAQRRGWPKRARGDGGDALHWSDVTVLSHMGVGQVFVPFSRVPPSSFEGAARRPYGGGWHSVTELTLALPHNVVQWWGWPHRARGWRNNAWAGFPGGVRGPAW
jgi:hypothetical protein